MAASDHYTIISADTHAGANHETYREYLDPKYLGDFDAWRAKYKNPWKDLRDTDLRVRNWDEERREADQFADGVVAEVVFPNTVPPFYPGFVLLQVRLSQRSMSIDVPGSRRTTVGSLTSVGASRPSVPGSGSSS